MEIDMIRWCIEFVRKFDKNVGGHAPQQRAGAQLDMLVAEILDLREQLRSRRFGPIGPVERNGTTGDYRN